ncbi:hypothetical protein NC652_006130 [Populus alba x Populus x berolinensis]|nr:hypothetical protein NC652_006130 [Populus alba x Populus x berolinensis]
MTCSWFLPLKVDYWIFKLTTNSDPGLGYLLINLFLVPVMWRGCVRMVVQLRDLLSQLEEKEGSEGSDG